MSSNISSSFASPEPPVPVTGGLRQRWPTLIVLPALIAILGAAVLAPLLTMFLGESFGLSGGREAPWLWALAAVGLVGFWTSKLVGSRGWSPNVNSVVVSLLGLVTIGVWFALEPVYDLGPALRNPVSLVQENGYLVPPLLIGLGVWFQGLRYDYDPGLFLPEEVRGNVQRSWALLAASIVIAAIIGGDAGDAAIAAATIAVPVAMVCSAGAIAAAEVANTRRIAQRRGGSVPGWDRWIRLFAGTAVFILVMTGLAALILGPEALGVVMSAIRAVYGALATVVYWIAFGIVYVLYWVFWGVIWILNKIFGDLFSPIEPPDQSMVGAPESRPPPEMTEGEFPYVTLLRWVALGIALLIAAGIIFQLSRAVRRDDDQGEVDEERQSIFSANLARQQLRDLFRRKPRAERPRKLNLDQPPGSVRESMLYLQVLATRQRVGREPGETPADFTMRLARLWPQVGEPLQVIRERYERARYGETPEDLAAAVGAWRIIWQHRKDVPIPPEPEPESESEKEA